MRIDRCICIGEEIVQQVGNKLNAAAAYRLNLRIDQRFPDCCTKAVDGAGASKSPGLRNESGKLVPLDVKVGDRVLFGKWSGTEVKIDDEELAIMKESDIFGIMK
jgi:hypothetical protein